MNSYFSGIENLLLMKYLFSLNDARQYQNKFVLLIWKSKLISYNKHASELKKSLKLNILYVFKLILFFLLEKYFC